MQPDIELLEFVGKGIEAGEEAFLVVVEKTRQVLATKNGPMCNYYLIKLKLFVEGVNQVYFNGFDEASRLAVEEDILNRYPGLRVKEEAK